LCNGIYFRKYNIIYQDGESWSTLFIPKENIEIVDWVNTNLKNPFKIMKRANVSYYNLGKTDLNQKRNETLANIKKHENWR